MGGVERVHVVGSGRAFGLRLIDGAGYSLTNDVLRTRRQVDRRLIHLGIQVGNSNATRAFPFKKAVLLVASLRERLDVFHYSDEPRQHLLADTPEAFDQI